MRQAFILCLLIAAFSAVSCRNAANAQMLMCPIPDDSGYPPVDIKEHRTSSRWENAVRKIEERYDASALPQGKVIFYGSSSIRKWKTLEEDMEGLDVLNHGFGGAKVPDCLYYADRLIVPFAPRAVVFYAGTNDIGKGASSAETFAYTRKFFRYLHNELPDTIIFYISQTQQPDRVDHWEEMHNLNAAVKKYAKTDPLVKYINTEPYLNNEDGSPKTELFVDDGLHFNEQGYEIWTSVIRPVLVKKLAAKEIKEEEQESGKNIKQETEKSMEQETEKSIKPESGKNIRQDIERNVK